MFLQSVPNISDAIVEGRTDIGGGCIRYEIAPLSKYTLHSLCDYNNK